MDKVILVKYGEIYLKGKNRKFFEKTLEKNIKNAVKAFDCTVERIPGRYEISGFNSKHSSKLLSIVGKIAGVYSFSLATVVNSNIKEIENVALELMEDNVGTFKVLTNRADKTFEKNSMELSRHIGGLLLSKFSRLSVDVHNPKHVLNIDIRENKKTYMYVSSSEYHGVGGMPVSSSGHGLILLSGGIDSPVAFI